MANPSLPADLDFDRDRDASPTRMNRAMLYLMVQIAGLQAARQTFDGMLQQLQSIGLTRINDALSPVFAELDAKIAEFQSVFENQTIDAGSYAVPGTRIGLRRSTMAGEVPGALNPGELGINEADGVLHWLDAGGAIRATALLDLATHADLSASLATVKAQVEGAAPGALDTLKELADAIADDPGFAATMTSALAQRLRIDTTQGLTVQQRTFGRTNLGAAASGNNADITGLSALMSMTCSGTANFQASIAVTSNAGVGGNLAVAGTATLTGKATLNGGLSVTGAVTFSGRPTWGGVTPYDTGNLTAGQLDAIRGVGILLGTANLTRAQIAGQLGYYPACNDWDGNQNIGLLYNGNAYVTLNHGAAIGYMWDTHNFNPATKMNNDGGATVVGFNGGNTNRPYISGSAYRDLAIGDGNVYKIALSANPQPYFQTYDGGVYYLARSNGANLISIRWNGSSVCVLVDNSEFALATASDERLKDVHGEVDAEDAFAKIKGLRPVEFDYLAKHGNDQLFPGRRYGFIAQDLEKVVPSMVRDGAADEDGDVYKVLPADAAMQICALLVKANQELTARVAALEAKSNG